MIQANDLYKTYGTGEASTRALRGVSLWIESGDLVSIMGPSGCGKTTLLHTLSGIDRMDSGEVWFNETALHELKDADLSEFRLQQMGFIFQSYHLIPVLTAMENVLVPLIARGMARNQAAGQAIEVLEKVGLADKRNAKPAELSGGQNQRLAIARAIVGNPNVIWADEPTGALDSKTAEQIMGLLCLINEKYKTSIVIVTHDPVIASYTQRTIRMENGRVTHD